MRRSLAALIISALAITVAACGGDDDDAGAPTTASGTAPQDSAPSVSVPAVEVPAETPTELVVTVITPGSGPEAVDGDSVFVNYVGVRSEDGTEFDNNYGGAPLPVTLGAGGVIPGWEQGLQGAQDGARLQLDIPAELAYGDQPPGEPIQPGDALSFVIDVLAVVPATDPADAPTQGDVPTSDEAASEVVVEDLTPGDGPELEEGDSAVLHLVAARSDTGEVLQSTWTGAPQMFVVAPGQFLDPLVTSLPGMKVGGRRAVTIPSATFEEQVASASTVVPDGADVVIIADLFAVL